MNTELASLFCGNVRDASFRVAGAIRQVDLVALAEANLNYLLRTPRPHLEYACRFCNYLSHCPPHWNANDSIANGDSDCRMDWEYPYMREMTGRTDGMEVDAGVRQRVLSYLDGDGYAHADGGIYCGGEAVHGEKYVATWTGGKILYTLANTYSRTGDASVRKLARRVFERLRSLATVRDGMAWYEGGAGPWRDGKWYQTFITCSYGVACGPMLQYGRACGDEEAVDWAARFARGSAAGAQENLGIRRVQADGTFGDQVHLHTHEAWGVAEVGLHLGDRSLLDWSQRVYQFVRSRGGDSGFFPERMVLPGTKCWDGSHDRAYVSETCTTADMIDIALCLARAGQAEYFDHVERYVRNYLRAAQFRLTDGVEAWYRDLHREKADGEVEAGLEMLRRDYNGAFLAGIAMTDWIHDATSLPQLGMMGCCVPEGMRAIHAAWQAAAEESGGAVKVHLAFDRDLPSAAIGCSLGTTGGVQVRMKQAARELLVRLPAWVEWDGVEVRVDGMQHDAARLRRAAPAGYLALDRPRSKQCIDVHWRQPQFEQSIEWGGMLDAPRQATFRWVGNSIVAAEAERQASVFPLYAPLH